MKNYVEKTIIGKVNEMLSRKKKQKFVWNDSIYEDLKIYLSIDERGQLGEEIIYDICKDISGLNIEYDSSVTDNEKGYDIIINNKKVEVKTATITSGSGMFQHEHLEAQRDYDYILFLDIAPNEVFLTLTKKQDVMWRRKKGDPANKTAIHRRPNGDYKCDFTIKHIKNNGIPKFRNFKTSQIKIKQDIINIIKHIL
ncbi:MAG: hypothetical protein DRQ51_08860 [Gammaproteobacteria bacterium]|nr:MAG: hypothetical protein DRQ51_08860 [Gammaproteobacteria bacterium]